MTAVPEFGRGAHWDGWRIIYRPPGAVPLVRQRYHIAPAPQPWVNISTRKVGGLRFIKIGRFCASFCITQTYTRL